MSVEIRVPAMGESITEAIVHQWFKKVGDAVAVDEPLLELETDKVAVEVNATAAGVIEEINAEPGSTVSVGAVIGAIKEGATPAAKPATAKPAAETAPTPVKPAPQPEQKPASGAEALPAARKLIAEQGLEGQAIAGTGKAGRVTKGDVLDHLKAAPAPGPVSAPAPAPAKPSGPRPEAAREERVRMSQLRKRSASQGSAEHRRHADHLQRGGYERGDGGAGSLS
jgi:2-oxoglutarate dehydrogenase E2 component (dihydrolipoamide succinyltransferase)